MNSHLYHTYNFITRDPSSPFTAEENTISPLTEENIDFLSPLKEENEENCRFPLVGWNSASLQGAVLGQGEHDQRQGVPHSCVRTHTHGSQAVVESSSHSTLQVSMQVREHRQHSRSGQGGQDNAEGRHVPP